MWEQDPALPRPQRASDKATAATARRGWQDALGWARRGLGTIARPERPYRRPAPSQATGPTQADVPLAPLPPAAGPTVLARVRAAVCETGALDDETLDLLLRRETPKTESARDLIAAPIERAFESILADELIRSMPASLCQPFVVLGEQAASALEQAAPSSRHSWLQAMYADLMLEFPPSWSPKAPLIAFLCASDATDSQKYTALAQFWRQPLADGYQALASMTILRALYMGAERLGVSRRVAPFVSPASNFYVHHLLSQTGRARPSASPDAFKQAGAGLTEFGAPSPIDASWMLPAVHASHRHAPTLDNSQVREALQYGNPYGVGISGSTNLFLFAAAHFQQQRELEIDALSLTTSLAAMLCYNGGHSLHECFAAAQQFPRSVAGQLSSLSSYRPGHARAVFVALADPQQTGLLERSLARLVVFVQTAALRDASERL